MSSLRSILLFRNKLSALHPKMFSHLTNLKYLHILSNPCISKNFDENPSKIEIERELAACGAGYKKHEQENLGARFEEIETIVDEKFEFLKELFERNQETCENQIKIIGGKFGNLEKRFEEMQKKFDEHNEENAGEMREIKRMLEKMTSAK
jgi:type I site-specific restriction-modification system R (restriction) subunit